MSVTPVSLEKETDAPAERAFRNVREIGQLPRVNLLPPEIAERQRMRRLQKGLAATVTLAALVVVALQQQAAHERADAQRQLDAATATSSLLATQEHAYASVPVVLKQAQAAKAILTQAMGSEVRWSLLLSDLDAHVPQGVWLTTIDVVAANATTTATSGIATIRFGGSAVSHDAVAAWLVSLGHMPGLSDAYLTSSVEAPGSGGRPATFAFTSTVTVTTAALSDRYTASSGG